MELKKAYPNYVQAINQMKDTTDLTKGLSTSIVLSHFMSYRVFGNKLADIYIDLNKYEDFVYVSFSSMKGISEKARTTGERIYKDLPVEEWIETIAEVMNLHNANPNHTQLVTDFTKTRVSSSQTKSVKNSGCMVSLLFIIIPIVSYFF